MKELYRKENCPYNIQGTCIKIQFNQCVGKGSFETCPAYIVARELEQIPTIEEIGRRLTAKGLQNWLC